VFVVEENVGETKNFPAGPGLLSHGLCSSSFEKIINNPEFPAGFVNCSLEKP
jgi:hypothetical protein